MAFSRITMHLQEIVDFWPDAEKPFRRWKCRLCRKHRPPRELGVEGIMQAAAAHAMSVHRAVIINETEAESLRAWG